jgi:hypothetical protein
MSLYPEQISVLLTAAIDVKGIDQMQRTDIQTRLDDYRQALSKWLDDIWVKNIIFVENSGYPLDSLKTMVQQHPSRKNVEFLTFDGQNFPRSLGKGYGETLALQYVLVNSEQLTRTGRFIKVNGRYYVPNLLAVLQNMSPDTEIFCNITKALTFSDSRVFGGSRGFLEYVCHEGKEVNDSKGFWFEHALAKASLHSIADGMKWGFIVRLPVVEGVSGTFNGNYSEPAIKQWVKGRVHALKQRLLRW